MEVSSIKRVLGLVSCYTPKFLDRENIAMDILLESWSHRIEDPSIEFIKNRCFNAMRSLKLEQRGVVKKLKELHQQQSEQAMRENADQVNHLTKVLSPPEKKIILYRFYMDMTIKEISDQMKMTVLQTSEALQAAIFKMREAA